MNVAAVVSGVFLFGSPIFILRVISFVTFMITGPVGVSSYLVETFVEPTISAIWGWHKGTPV